MSAYKRINWVVALTVVTLAGVTAFAQQEAIEDQELINLLNRVNADSSTTPDEATEAVSGETNALDAAEARIDEVTLDESMLDELGMDASDLSVETGTDNRISIRFKGGLEDAITLFAQLSGANIIVPELAEAAQVSVNLKDVEWRPALQSILDTYDYELYQRVAGSNVYSVRRRPAGAPEAQVVETFVLKYATVPNAAGLIRQLLPEDAKVSEFASRNMLVVKSTESSLGEVRSVLESIDTVRQQVFIESKFMELSDDAQKDLGIDWVSLGDEGFGVSATASGGAYGKEFSTETPSENLWNDLVNGSASFAGSGEYALLTSVLDADQFRVVLNAMENNKGVNIVSNPKIIVANEEPANISIVRKEPNLKQDRKQSLNNTEDTITFTLDPDLPFFEYGIKLDVIPSINTSSNISVRINPALTRKFADKLAGENTYPIIDEKSIQTVFNLSSGQTAAIGGLTEATEGEEERKVPLLGSIPLVGRLFSWKQTVHGQSETVIFVTVGLANTQQLNTETGMPSDSELARRQVIMDRNDRLLRDQRREYYEAQESDELDAMLLELEEMKQKRLEKLERAEQKARAKSSNEEFALMD